LQRVGLGHFAVQDSRAGMHVVAWLPHMTHAQCDRLIGHASKRGLGLHPIAPHYKKPPRTPGLLMGYAALSVAEIDAAMSVLEGCVKEIAGPAKRG
jgi:GntR family transcriptional regulator/MocR family aminotransferase